MSLVANIGCFDRLIVPINPTFLAHVENVKVLLLQTNQTLRRNYMVIAFLATDLAGLHRYLLYFWNIFSAE